MDGMGSDDEQQDGVQDDVQHEKRGSSRRDFLKGAGLVAAGAVAGGAGGA
ncbi:Tat pathway signal sequence domain protein, partial [Leifsonia aquatica ATCC 14665]